MTVSDRLIVVLGSGPGIGIGVASLFASRGFSRVALLSRNAERLQTDAKSVLGAVNGSESHSVNVKTYSVDLADSKALERALGQIESDLGVPEVVVYNASHLTTSKFFNYTEEEINEDLKVSTTSLYTAAKWAMSHLTSFVNLKDRNPAFLVTSGGLFKDPWAPYFSLSLSKAAQHSLTMTLSQEFSKKGVHVAAVVVHGLVKPDSEFFSPAKIAETFWALYQQGAQGEKEVWVTAPKDDKASADWTARQNAPQSEGKL